MFFCNKLTVNKSTYIHYILMLFTSENMIHVSENKHDIKCPTFEFWHELFLPYPFFSCFHHGIQTPHTHGRIS